MRVPQLPIPCKTGKPPGDENCTKSTLLSMPAEILDWVVREIPYRHDLGSLSRTCKTLKDAVFPRLYSKLVLKVPQSWSQLKNFEYLLASSGEGLQYTTCVRITTFLGPVTPSKIGLRQPSEAESAVAQQIYYPDVSASIHLNALVRILLRQLPKQQIRQESGAFGRDIIGLQSLSFRSLEGNSLDWLRSYSSPQNALKHLTLGAEIDAIQRFYRPGSGLDEKYDVMLDDFMKKYVDNDDDDDDRDYFMFTLDSFRLIGLSVNKLIRGPSSFLDFSDLISLSLEDCLGVEDFFTVVQNANNKQGVKTQSLLRLRSFHLRYMFLNHNINIRAPLFAFLTSIPGLTNLSILLQANERPQDFRGRSFGNVLLTHGKFLRTLVWEERITCRESYVERSNATFPSQDGLVEIALSCNNLVELSIPIDWSIFRPKWGSSTGRTRKALQSLAQLRTLNIRNMPSFDTTTTGIPINGALQGFVDSALAALIVSTHVKNRMPLDTLALGAMTYRDVRNGLGLTRVHEKDLYQFLRLRIYAVDRRYRFEGKPKPLAIFREVGTYEKTEAAGYGVEVLKPYWLG
ncbi:MAG: hypothetical protein LQ349_003893 [Xanthoria aureola]|nr:MAG: hypothetical protein LQ349_003893 [Xanthoria aureola]